MAEFIMKQLVREAGCADRFTIASAAATYEEIGNDMYPPARHKLQEKGIPFSRRAARILTGDDYANFDYIIGMDRSNLTKILRITGGDPEKKVSALLDWTDRKGAEVADPWYTGNFEATYRDLTEGCTALLQALIGR